MTPRRARVTILCLLLIAFVFSTLTACKYGVYLDLYFGDNMNCPNDTSPNSDYDYLQSDREMKTSIYDNHTMSDKQAVWQKYFRYYTMSYNITIQGTICLPKDDRTVVYWTGLCYHNTISFSASFHQIVQRVYLSTFVISFVIVFILYSLILRAVLKGQAWKTKTTQLGMIIKPRKHNTTEIDGIVDQQHEEKRTIEQLQGCDDDNTSNEGPDKITTNRCCLLVFGTTDQRSNPTDSYNSTDKVNDETDKSGEFSDVPRHLRRPKNKDLLANIRCAAILFVVTLVFIISFLPAWLIALKAIEIHSFVYYMYYVNNVANPVIYAFMNKSFRDDLKGIFQKSGRYS